jgi:hypothetical protein
VSILKKEKWRKTYRTPSHYDEGERKTDSQQASEKEDGREGERAREKREVDTVLPSLI